MTAQARRSRRDTLLDAIIPSAPDPNLPPTHTWDRQDFWDHFDASAPPHLRHALNASALALVVLLPRILGNTNDLDMLSPNERDATLSRGASLPIFADLLEVAKVVACMALFSHPDVQRHVRGAP